MKELWDLEDLTTHEPVPLLEILGILTDAQAKKITLTFSCRLGSLPSLQVLSHRKCLSSFFVKAKSRTNLSTYQFFPCVSSNKGQVDGLMEDWTSVEAT